MQAVQYHLYHNKRTSIPKNDEILEKTIKEKLAWCENGIDKYFKEL